MLTRDLFAVANLLSFYSVRTIYQNILLCIYNFSGSFLTLKKIIFHKFIFFQTIFLVRKFWKLDVYLVLLYILYGNSSGAKRSATFHPNSQRSIVATDVGRGYGTPRSIHEHTAI